MKNTSPRISDKGTKMDLPLSVKRSRFRHDDPLAEHADAAFKEKAALIKRRDDYRCAYCALQSKKYQEVHHLDDDHHNNDESNLVTVCPLCHAVCHLGLSARRKAGTLIYVDPSLGMKQADLNALVRCLWVMERSKDKELQITSVGYQARLNRQVIKARRHYETSDPGLIADILLGFSEEDYRNRAQIFPGLLFLPQPTAFEPALRYWCESLFQQVQPDDWAAMSEDKAARWLLGDDRSELALAEALGIT